MKNRIFNKRVLSLLLTLLMIVGVFPAGAFAVSAEDSDVSFVATDNVAKVGNTEYATIDEAIAAWTNNTTLTLLADVTLSDVVTLKSTEHHILNLGTYTMTAAEGKNAFVIQACGTGSAERSAITINADATNPGGINAGSKCVVYYKYADGGISTEDRPIIKINGGVFTGSTSSFGTAGIYTIGTAARKCATVNVTGGTFNCSIVGSTKSKLIVSGGTFNYTVSSQGDSTCSRLISGGTFKTLGFMTADSNNTKFWIGTSMGNSNVGVHVDDNGYIVVGGPVVTEAGETFEASSANYSGASSYLQYSSAVDNGLYYTSVEEAFADNNKTTGEVTVYVDELDMTGISYKGTIVVPDGNDITITNAPSTLKVQLADGTVLTPGEDGTVTTIVPVEVATYDELVAALANGGSIKLTNDITVDEKITAIDGTTIDLNEKTLYVNVEDSYYNNVTIKNGNIVLGKDDVHVCDGYFLVNAGKTLVVDGVKISSSDEGIKGYAVFHLKTGANLDLINSELNISDNEYSAGYIVYAGESTATVDVVDTTVTGNKVNGIVHATTVIENSAFTITNATEHGINRSGVTITDSTVAISGGTGRGITAQHGPLVINGNSNVTIEDMGEATIELRNNQNLTIAETATVKLDAAVNNTTSGTITGTVILPPMGTITTAYTSATTIWGEATGNASTSFAVRLYSGDTLLVTATLNDPEGVIIDGNIENVTWNIPVNSVGNDSWWTIVWDNYITATLQPTKVVAVVDGVEVADNSYNLNAPDDLSKICAATTDADGKILAYHTTLAAAIENGENVVLLRDVVLTDTLTVPAGKTVVLDLNGKTISQEKACTSSYEMIANNGTLTITGNGKISFKDTGAGDPNAGWGSYTIRNSGTLVVENGTIEHLGEQNQAGQAFAHTTLAIFQYSGSTTINGGTISTPNYRSIRLWSGDVTINGGNFVGQVWVHCVNDTADLTINGGSFAPAGNDGSSVFVNNSGYTAVLSVTGGTFSTKIGANDVDALAGAIIGGTFTEAAKTGTNGALLGEYFEFTDNGDGTYGVAEKAKPTVDGVEVVINFNDGDNSYDITLADGATFPGNGVTMSFPATGDANGMAYVVHKHVVEDVTYTYIYVGKVSDGKLSFKNTVGFSTFTVYEGGLEDAFAAAAEGDTIVLLTDATPALTSQRAITKAAVIDLGGKTLTLTEDDLYFGTTTFKNGTIVVDPSVKPSTAVFWMFANQTLTFDGVKIVATGVTGTYLIGLDGNNSDLNLLNGSEILVENTNALDLDIICVNASTGNDILVENSKVNVTNLDGRVFFRGNYTVKGTSEIALEGITKAGFRIEAGQTLSIEDTAKVTITGEPRDGGIHLTDLTATYTKAETATVNATVSAPKAVAQIGETKYTSLQEALNAAVAGTGNVTVEILVDINLTNVDWTPVTVSAPGYPCVTVNGNNKTITGLNDMLFAGTWAGGSGLIINDLTIANSTIVNDENDSQGTVGVGAFIGFPQASSVITLNNCHLVNSTVKGGHWTGGLIGYAAGYAGTDGPVFMNLTINNCSVTGSTITGKGSAGGIIGHATGNAWTDVAIENTTVSGNTVTSTGSSTNKAGAVVGTIGAAGQATTVNGVEHTGGVSVSATVSGNTVTSNGTTITTVYGRQGTNTGMLEIAGGSYDSNPIEENVSYAAPVAGYKIVKNTDGSYGIAVDPAYGKVAKIGDTYYATLAEAVAAAESGDTIILKNGEYDLPLFSGKELTFKGESKDGVIINDAPAAVTQGWLGSTFHFESLTAKGATANYHGLANGVVAVTYKNCNVNGLRFLYAPVTFEDCAFNAKGVEHSFWTYGSSSVTVKNCTFTYTDRAVNCYSENGANHEVDIAFSGCTFTYAGTSDAPAGAVEINSGSVKSIDLTMNGCTAPAKGDMWFNSQWDSKKGQNTIVTVDNVVVWKPLQGSGTAEDPILINDLADLILFRDTVNTYTQDGSNQFKGKYVKLTADIDLAGINWTPIGTNSVGDHAAFLGIFDGDGHTISNLYINADGGHLGFFARVGSYAEGITPTVKNIKFNNVNVSSNTTTSHNGSYVAGVIANAGGNSVVSNITVAGNVYVEGYGYVGGIVGHGYPDIDNCHVDANDGSYVKAHYWCAGGIIGYAGEGGTPITNSSVAGVDIWSAYGAAAAIAGLLQDGNKLENVSASNVEITSNSDYCMGYIAGNGEASTMTNVTITNVTATANGNPITATDAIAKIGDAIYFNLQSAIDAVKAGDTIVLLRDVVLEGQLINGWYEGIYYEGDKSFTLDLGGHSITCADTVTDYAFNIKNLGTKANEITIKNGTITGGTAVWSVFCVGSSAELYPTTVTLESVTVNAGTNSQWGDLAIKVRGASTVNLKSGTKVVGQSGTTYVVASEGNGTLNIYDGAEITACAPNAPAVSGNGTVNIYGGTITATNGAFAVYTYSSGTPVVNIYDGTITGDVYAHADVVNDPTAVATVNISGGTFNGKLVESYYGTPATDCSKVVVTGGTFDQDPTAYVVDGYVAVANNGTYTVGKAVAKVGDKFYTTLADALKALVDGSTLTLLEDITISEAWDCRTNGAKITASNVKINGNGKTLKLTGEVKDNNWNTVFRVEGNEVWFHDLTIDVSEATGVERGISAKLNLDVTECIFIGNDTAKRAIIYGEGAGSAISNVKVQIIGSKFTNWSYGVSDNQNAQDAKYVDISNCEFVDANVLVSASETVYFDNNKMDGGYVNISSYSVPNALNVRAMNTKVDSNYAADNKIVAKTIANANGFQTPVAEVGGKYYMTLEEALKAAKGEENIVINLVDDATLDITAWETLAIGGDTTKTITINGNGKTLTFNKLNSDWNHITTNNDAKLILNNMTITDSGYNNGPWNRYDLNFACDVELNDVKANKAVAFKADATLNDVTINETGDNYAIWIQPNGQTVAIDSLTVTSAGRGIKIDQQYVDAPAIVELSVENATFTTAKKAAILVKTTAGANIVLENVDISGVAADSVNAVWNDADTGAEYGDITVTGGTLAQEDATEFAATLGDSTGVKGYYKTLADAFAAAQADETVKLLSDIETANTIAIDKSITIDGGNHKLTYTGSDRAIDVPNTANGANVTIKNLTLAFTGGYSQRGINYNTNGKLILDNVTVNGTNVTYAVNMPSSSDNAEVEINNSSITGLIALNVWGANAKVNVTNTELTSVDNATHENYAAVKLNNNGTDSAEGTTITITGGSITALDENGNLSSATTNATATGEITISDTTVVIGNHQKNVAAVLYSGASEFYGCFTLQEAIDKATNDPKATVKLLRDITISEKLVIEGNVTIDGNGKTITYTGSDRIMDVAAANVKLTLKDINLVSSASYCQRGINIGNNVDLTLDNVSVKGTNVTYALNLAGASDNAKVTITDSDLTGCIALNVWGKNVVVNATNSEFVSVDTATHENYSAIVLNNNGSYSAENTVINITGGSITALDENGAPSIAIRNASATGVVNVSDTTVVTGDTREVVAIVTYNGYDEFYSHFTLQDAINKAENDPTATVKLLKDITISEKLVIEGNVTIDGNGKTITYTGTDRAIDVPNTANGANVTIKNLKVDAENANRGFNYNTTGEFTVENVIVTIGANVDGYAINFPGSADGAKVTITNSKLTSRNPLNIWGENMEINVVDSEITSVDNNSTYFYSAIQLNKDTYGNAAEGTVVTVTGGKITALDEEGEPSFAVTNWCETGIVNISDTTVITGNVQDIVAWIGGVGFPTLQAAVNSEYTGTIEILRDFAISESVKIPAGKKVTIDLNGKTISGDTKPIVIEGGELTIKDSVGNGAVVATGYFAVQLPGSGKLTLESGTLKAGSYAVYLVNAGSQFVMNGGTVEGNMAIGVNGGNAEIKSGTIIAHDMAAPMYVWSGSMSISGGTFSFSPSADYIEYGYGITENADGTYTVSKVDPMIFIGSNSYYTLDEAFKAASENDVITITKAGKYTWTNTAVPAGVTVKGTVEGVVVDGNRTIINATKLTVENIDFTALNEAVYITNGKASEITFTDCSFTGNYSLLVDSAADGSVFTFNNCIFNGFTTFAKSVGAVNVNGGEINNRFVVRQDAEIKDAAISEVDAAGIQIGTSDVVTGVNVTMTGCTVKDANNDGTVPSIDELIVTNNVSDDSDNMVVVDGKVLYGGVAKIGETRYATLAEAIAAAQADDTIVVLVDVTLTETLTIPADKTITLDLNGKTISMADASSNTAAAIKNNGNLTIKSSVEGGKITFNSTTPSANNGYASNTISNYGTITIESGIIENTTVGGACYALDNYAGSTATINGGKLTAEKTTVRIFNWTNGDAAKATLNVTDGEIYSADGYAINVNSGNAPAVELNITGGTITTDDTDYNLAVYIVNKGSAENLTAAVTGGTFNGNFALNGVTSTTMKKNAVSVSGGTFEGIICYETPAYGFVSGGTFKTAVAVEYCAAGYIPKNINGVWTIVEGNIGDVSGDGKLTSKDVVLLRQYVVGLNTAIQVNVSLADVTGDGLVSSKDVVALRQIIAARS